MIENKPKLNINKTSLMYIGTRQRLDTCVELTSNPLKMDDQINDNYTSEGVRSKRAFFCNLIQVRFKKAFQLKINLINYCLKFLF